MTAKWAVTVLDRQTATSKTMLETSMINVARSGELGNRCHGLDHDGLRTVIGDPTDWGAGEKQERARIWCYGDIEFHFGGWRVYMIFSDHGDMTDGGGSLHIDPWIIRRGLPRQEFQNALMLEGIEFKAAIPDHDSGQCIVTTQSGAKFTFVEHSDDEAGGLVAWVLVVTRR